MGFAGVLDQCRDDVDVGCEVALYVSGFNVEDVDEDADVGEDVGALLGKVVFHKGFLSAAVPEVEGEVAEEFDVGEVDVYCCASIFGSVIHVLGESDRGEENIQSAGIAGEVIGEDDASHTGFSGAAFAHEEDLLLLDFFELSLCFWNSPSP